MQKITQKVLKEKGGIKLNAEQMSVVRQLEGVSVVEAGPGTGKTSVIIGKITYASLTNPCATSLTLTFSKRAVAEIQSRILGVSNVMVSTFHSFFLRILRSYGFRHFNFIENDAKKNEILHYISNKEEYGGRLDAEMIKVALQRGITTEPLLKRAVEEYLEVLKDKRMLCCDSLQFFTLELLQNKPSVAIKVRGLYDFVLVDEAQDISYIQRKILQSIWVAHEPANLTFVGDSRQSIYGFRGTEVNVMDKLVKNYNATVFTLGTNYRSTETILKLAEDVLPNSRAVLKAIKGKGEMVETYIAEGQQDEAIWITNEIQKLVAKGVRYNQIAVVFRSAPNNEAFYEQFYDERIPFAKIGSDVGKANNSRSKHFMAILALLYDYSSSRFKCALPLIGLPNDVIENIDDTLPVTFLEKVLAVPTLSRKHKNIIKEFTNINPEEYSFTNLCCLVWDKYLKAYYKANDDRILEDFLIKATQYQNFTEFHKHFNKMRRISKQMKKLLDTANSDFVRLISIHSAKGCEFDYVFLVNLVDGVIPNLSYDGVRIDEEQRLAFVGVTRTAKKLYLSYSQQNGNKPSRFFATAFKERKV